MTFSTLTQAGSGTTQEVANDAISGMYQFTLADGVTQATEVLVREPIANIIVQDTVANVVAGLTAPAPTFVTVTLTNGKTARLVPGHVDDLVALGVANSRCYVQDGTVLDLVGTPAVIAALLDAATPPVTASTPPLLLGFAVVVGTTGAIAPGSLTIWDNRDIVIASDPAYVGGSGVYRLPITGTEVPAAGVLLGWQPFINGGLCASQTYAANVGTWTIVDPAGAAYEPGSFTVLIYGVLA